MRTLIENLRQKPERHRKAVAFAVSGGFTLLIALVWGITLPVRFATITAKASSQPAAALAASPLESLKQSLNGEGIPRTTNTEITNSAAVISTSSSNKQTSNGVTISDINSGVSPFNGQ